MTTRGLVISLGLALGCSAPSSSRPAPGSSAAEAQASAIAVGATAPEAQLVGTTGQKVALAEQLHHHAQTVVVFYRGFW